MTKDQRQIKGFEVQSQKENKVPRDEDMTRTKGNEPLQGLGRPMARARTKKAKEALQQMLTMLFEFRPKLQVEKLRISSGSRNSRRILEWKKARVHKIEKKKSYLRDTLECGGGEHQLDGTQRFLLDALNAQMQRLLRENNEELYNDTSIVVIGDHFIFPLL
ncbi:hypothetical protein HKD37_07G019599 [Glycine soja]